MTFGGTGDGACGGGSNWLSGIAVVVVIILLLIAMGIVFQLKLRFIHELKGGTCMYGYGVCGGGSTGNFVGVGIIAIAILILIALGVIFQNNSSYLAKIVLKSISAKVSFGDALCFC